MFPDGIALIVLRGMLLGLSLAVPLGPINLEIIRRGLTLRPRAGYAIGLGACTMDGIYALLAALSLGRLLQAQALVTLCQAAGAVLLGWLARGAIRQGLARWREAAPEEEGETPAAADGARPGGARPEPAFFRGYLTGLAMTASSPLNIVFWLTVPARFFAGHAVTTPLALLTSVSVLMGTFCWVSSLTAALTFARRWLAPRLLAGISVAGGAGLAGFALWSAWGALKSLV